VAANGPDGRAGDGVRLEFVDASAVLADAEDQVIDEAVAALAQRDETRQSPRLDEHRRDVRQLFHLVLRCMRAGRGDPIIRPSEHIAAHCYAAGVDLAEVDEALKVLAEVLWRRLTDALFGEQLVQALGLLNAIVGQGKDAMARTYVALAIRDRHGHDEQSPGDSSAAGRAYQTRAGDVVLTAVVGQVGIITLEDRPKRNAIGTQMATAVIAALESLRARQVRAIVLRAAAGMHVWSAGHDIDELPPGGRDPLGYNDPLEGLIRAVRTFPAPVIAMVHGTVWGGAVDLVLSCDLAVADETASFAITPANLGLPYNITGLLHFQGRLPINVIKEMFFTAAPIDARKAKEWLLINHLVPWDRLESFTLELAATMATKSPLAVAVIKEQLRVLSDYQPIAAQVYERVQGLREEAYDSSDYREGLNAFTEKRQPIFRGT
jgi:methylmalonyl-CoA decarboxylase